MDNVVKLPVDVERTKNGTKKTITNAAKIITRWSDAYEKPIRYNTFAETVEVGGQSIRDYDLTQIRIYSEALFDWQMSKDIADEAAEVVARRDEYHPVVEYLEELPEWDGTDRLSNWLVGLAGADETTGVLAVSRAVLIGAVARVLDPGCKMDNVLLLIGPQGAKKSELVRNLSPNRDWVLDSLPNIGNQHVCADLFGKWIIEVDELSALTGNRLEQVKSFITRQVDRYTPKYKRHAINVKRQFVMIGTTNEDDPLVDSTGNRRWWPVEVSDSIDVDALIAMRDQLWAEALAAYRNGERWWIDNELMREAQEGYTQRDAWHSAVAAYVAGLSSITTMEILKSSALKLPEKEHTRYNQGRVARILIKLGYKRKRVGKARDIIYEK